MSGTDDDSTLFPQKLMAILADPVNHESIAWLPKGQAFVIRNRKLFAETVMPRYFSRKAQYSSFTRKLNRWNFTRVSSGPELGAYHHQFFLRDQPHLAAQMFCKNARTMLAMASASATPTVASVEKLSAPPTSSVRSSDPTILAVEASNSNNNDNSERLVNASNSPSYFDHNMSLQLLERQISFLHQQKEHANRMLMERALLMHQHLQRDQESQSQMYAQLGIPAPPPRQPSNNRASAA